MIYVPVHGTDNSLLFSAAVDLKNAPGAIYPGEPRGEKPGCTLTLSDQDFVGLVNGEVKAQQVCTELWSTLRHACVVHTLHDTCTCKYTKLHGHQPRDLK